MTRKLVRTVAVACLVAAAALAIPASSGAEVAVGIGDQNAQDTFPNPLFKDLKLRRARIVAPWNLALKRGDRKYMDNWLKLARASGIEPLVHFASATGSLCPGRPCKLPSVSEYTKAFKAFRRRYPTVQNIGVWNEANHRSQPTFKNPKRAAEFFNVVRRNCAGCRIVAADIIDETNMASWLAVFKRTARGVRIWGLHNYRDTNPRSGQIFGGTRKFLRLVRGEVWLTETGGIVKFVLPNRRTAFPFSEARANTAVKRMFNLAKQNRRRIKRLYIYHWRAPIKRARFDAGLVRHNKFTDPSARRPAYFTVQRNLNTPYFGP